MPAAHACCRVPFRNGPIVMPTTRIRRRGRTFGAHLRLISVPKTRICDRGHRICDRGHTFWITALAIMKASWNLERKLAIRGYTF